jgi:glutaredoxin-dependent peroxiredoxin
MLEVGKMAPGFTLYNSEKQKVSLEEQRGNVVVLLFFPFAFTSVCTRELCEVRDNISFYSNLNAKIFGISVDSPYTLARYKEEQKLNFQLLSDFNKTVSQAYDSLYEEFSFDLKGVSKRSAFVLDADGRIRYAEVLENASEVPDFGIIEKVVEELGAETENKTIENQTIKSS